MGFNAQTVLEAKAPGPCFPAIATDFSMIDLKAQKLPCF